MKKDENMEWEEEAPLLVSLPRTNPYRVPDKYFESLGENIQQSVFLEGLMENKEHGFSVPHDYFKELNAEIESKIARSQIHSLVTSDGFKIPANYFERLNSEILSKTIAVPKRKVVRLWQTDFMKYAAAACFILVTASGLYVNEQQNAKEIRANELVNEQILYDIEESVIFEHIQESQTAATTTTDAELESYILDNFSSTELSNNL